MHPQYSGRRPGKKKGACPKPCVHAGFPGTPPPHLARLPCRILSGRVGPKALERPWAFPRDSGQAWAGPLPSPPRRPGPGGGAPGRPRVHRNPLGGSPGRRNPPGRIPIFRAASAGGCKQLPRPARRPAARSPPAARTGMQQNRFFF